MVKYRRNPDAVFAALSQPTRRRIVEELSVHGERSFSELQRPLGVSLPAVSKHMEILRMSGLVSCEKRGRTHYCTLNPDAIAPMVEWLAAQRGFWSSSMDRLEAHVSKHKKKK